MADENEWGSGDTQQERDRRLRAHERWLKQETAKDLASRYGISPLTPQSRMEAFYGNALRRAYGFRGKNFQENLGVVPAGEAVTLVDDKALVDDKPLVESPDSSAERNRRAQRNRRANRELEAAAAAGGRYTLSDDDILRGGV